MDKLKKVLSGQDTEDRSGLSEVRAPGELAFLGKLPCCPPARGAELCRDTATGGSAGFVEGVALEPSPTFPPKGLRL